MIRTPGDPLDPEIEIYDDTLMQSYKFNQVETAIFLTLGAKASREIRLRLKRLLVADRNLARRRARSGADRNFAFFSGGPRGSGVEVRFTEYEAFALLIALKLLAHGLPQGRVVKTMRQVRSQLEQAHAATMRKDAETLFDQQEVRQRAMPGAIAIDNTSPVFLTLLKPGALTNPEADTVVAVCHGEAEVMSFIKKHPVGSVATIFEYVGLMRALAAQLAVTRPSKRGRGATSRRGSGL